MIKNLNGAFIALFSVAVFGSIEFARAGKRSPFTIINNRLARFPSGADLGPVFICGTAQLFNLSPQTGVGLLLCVYDTFEILHTAQTDSAMCVCVHHQFRFSFNFRIPRRAIVSGCETVQRDAGRAVPMHNLLSNRYH